MTIADAKEIVLIPQLWAMLDLPGTPSRSCRAPWREDRSPSFSVSENGKLWHDFAEGTGGDVVTFLQKARSLSQKDACRELVLLASAGVRPVASATSRHPAQRVIYRPQMREGSAEELRALSELRHLSPDGLKLAQDAGVLGFSNLREHPAWIVTDKTSRNFQARRLDGKTWEHIGGKKAWTLPGSQAAWPIGILNADTAKAILLFEGAPDLLAAFHFIAATNRRDFTPVAMLGAGLRIHADALPHFAGKHVRLFPHLDKDGQGYLAAVKWQSQLESINATVDAFSFAGLTTAAGVAVKDLNDCARLSREAIAALNLWEGL